MEREESIQTHLKMYLENFYEEDIQAPFDIVGYSKENHTSEVKILTRFRGQFSENMIGKAFK